MIFYDAHLHCRGNEAGGFFVGLEGVRGCGGEEARRNILHLDDADPAAGRSAIQAAEGQRRHRATQVLAAEDPSVGEIRRSANEAAYAADARQFKTGM